MHVSGPSGDRRFGIALRDRDGSAPDDYYLSRVSRAKRRPVMAIVVGGWWKLVGKLLMRVSV